MSEPRPSNRPKAGPTSVRRPVGAKARPKDLNPAWYAPVMVGLMLIGLLWIVTYYLTQGRFPVQAWGNWNLGAGALFALAGFLMTTGWK